MSKWTLTQWFGAAVFAGLFAAGTLWLVPLVLKFAQLPTVVYNYEATAQAERLEQCLDCESELHALQTRLPAMLALADCTPDATLVYVATSVAPRVAAVEQRIGTLEWVQVAAAAILAGGHAVSTPPMDMTPQPTVTPRMATSTPMLETPTQAVTPRATMTPDVLPTATPVPTIAPLCRPCLAYGRDCPTGFVCAQCRAGMWRCVPGDSVNASCQKCVIAAMPMPVTAPIWIGLAVWNEDTTETASGEPFDGDAMSCAVDVSLFKQFRDRILHICVIPGYGVNEARCVDVRVNDCGPLAAAGLFVYESRPRGALTVTRYWQGDGDGALPVVVDLTRAAMRELTGGTLETCAVTVTLVE